MLYVVGLGNPGREYEGTRHNVGFDVVDLLAERHGFPAQRKFKRSKTSRGTIRGQEVLLVKPMTYMNLSGEAVLSIMSFYKGAPRDVIVVHDDLDFEPGMVRIKLGGGHGGHNGLESIISHVGRDFARIRVGIGKPESAERGADHVLSGFDRTTRQLMDAAIVEAAAAVELMIEEGTQAAMNRFNRRKPRAEEEEAGEE